MGAEIHASHVRSHVYCTHCGGANPLYAKFCGVCGSTLPTHNAQKQLTHAIDLDSASLPVASPPAAPSSSSKKTISTDAALPSAASSAASEGVSALSPLPARLLKQRYRILARIGTGGYGRVYQAIDTAFMQRRVAIKEMIQQGLSPQELTEATEGFKREATLLASLTHPNLPSIYDYFDEGGSWYVVMSFIEGETLDDYVRHKGGSLAVEKVLHIGIQLAGVLSYLHTRKPPIIFRDLKPSNVMRTPEGQIYLIDFGIARHFKQGQPKDTMVLGSPGYAAPEQYGRRQTTPQADIYSLGALLHELLSGKNPTLSPFSQKPLDLPQYPQLSTLIQCMLELDVKKRPGSMRNIQHELQRIASGKALPITNVHRAIFMQASSPYPAVSPPAGPPVPSAQAAQPAQAPSSLAGSFLRYLPKRFTASVPAVKPSNASSPDKLPNNIVFNGLETLRSAGSLLSVGAQRGQEYLAALWKTSEPDILPGPVVSWSPDSRYLAVITATRAVMVLDGQSLREVTSYHGHGQSVISALAWSADGATIASAAIDGSVHLWNSSNGRLLQTFRHPDGRVVLSLAWSPDGAMLALGDAAGSVTLCVSITLAVTTSAVTYPREAIYALTWSPDSQCVIGGGLDGTVTFWRVSQSAMHLLSASKHHAGRISALSCSPDGLSLASSSWDHMVRIWNMDDAAHVVGYSHADRVTALAWSSNGEHIASASLDKKVHIWRVPYVQAFRYEAHQHPVLGVSWSGDDRIASLDSGNILQIWRRDGTMVREMPLPA